MSYYVEQSELSGETYYNVVEKDTGQVISTSPTEKASRVTCRTLNLGSGFDGFTPNFFLNCNFVRSK